MDTITITHSEAQRTLNLLRAVQMNLGALTGSSDGTNQVLASPEFAGELNQAINELEASLWESDTFEMAGESAQHDTAEAALSEFQRHLSEQVGEEDIATLVMLARLAEREAIRSNAGPKPSVN